MLFIETPVFTREVVRLLDDEDYALLQLHLAATPDAGDLVAGTGGLRKLRWAISGTGKRGGVRVIYFHSTKRREIRLLLIYRKGRKDDLTATEKTMLRAINEQW